MVQYVIRPVEIQDMTLLWCWRNDPVVVSVERTPCTIRKDEYFRRLRRKLSNEYYCVMLAETEANALATSYVYSWKGETAEIGICMNPAFRGHGLSCRLLESFISHAQGELGFNRVSAEVRTVNTPSIRLFRKMGYSVDKTSNGIVYFSKDMKEPKTCIFPG